MAGLFPRSSSSTEALLSLFGVPGSSKFSDADKPSLEDIEKSVVTETVVQKPLLGFQPHEQIGKRYLFEIKLNQLLARVDDVDAEQAADLCIGLKNRAKFNHLPSALQEKINKLESVHSVKAVLENRKTASIFSSPRPGYSPFNSR